MAEKKDDIERNETDMGKTEEPDESLRYGKIYIKCNFFLLLKTRSFSNNTSRYRTLFLVQKVNTLSTSVTSNPDSVRNRIRITNLRLKKIVSAPNKTIPLIKR